MKEAILIITLISFAFGQNQESNLTLIDSKATNSSNTKNCTCVPYYRCNATTTSGTGVIDVQDTACQNYLDVCCKSADLISEQTEPPPQARKSCGYRNIGGVGFPILFDGNEAQYGEFPWMVAVLREEYLTELNQTINLYTCGGALIHPQAVLTAAHCVASLRSYKIRAGEWDTQTTKEIYPHQDRFVRNVVIHRDYSSTNLINDIAILFLDTPVELAENVNTLCLPEQDAEIPGGTRCFATGWGKDVHGKSGKYQVLLKRVNVPMVSHNSCQEKFRSSPLGERFRLHRSFVCAGGEKGSDTCDGDGGSPLACPVPGKENVYQHVGMVAWGAGCGEHETPGVYVNVGLYRDWIEKHFSIYGLKLAYFH